MNVKALVAEFIGTFALIFVGVGSIIASMNLPGGGSLLIPAFAHGLAIACLASAVGAISGGQFNPAVSIGLLAAGKMNAANAVGYVVAQILGATFASFLLTMIYPGSTLSLMSHGIPALGTNVTFTQGLIAEIVLTFFLVFVIYGTAVDSRAPKVGALFIGLTVTLDILMGGPVTGACMNPARYLGPAFISQNFQNIALYMIGPIIGGLLAALTYRYVLEDQPTTKTAKSEG